MSLQSLNPAADQPRHGSQTAFHRVGNRLEWPPPNIPQPDRQPLDPGQPLQPRRQVTRPLPLAPAARPTRTGANQPPPPPPPPTPNRPPISPKPAHPFPQAYCREWSATS